MVRSCILAECFEYSQVSTGWEKEHVKQAILVLDAMGYDVVLLETVGVGQDEVEVVDLAHTTAVVSLPGMGDDIQAMKAGILEI